MMQDSISWRGNSTFVPILNERLGACSRRRGPARYISFETDLAPAFRLRAALHASMHLKNARAKNLSFTRLYARIREEHGAFTVSVRLLDHRDQSQAVQGEEVAASIEMASSMIGCLAEQFSIPQKCISIDIGMENFKDGTLH